MAIYRELAEATPAVHLDLLMTTLANLATLLSKIGQLENAVGVFADAARGMAAGPRAEIHLALAEWLIRHLHGAEMSAQHARALWPRSRPQARKKIRFTAREPAARYAQS